MPLPEENSYIEELKKSLYSRTAPDVRTRRRTHVEEEKTGLKTDWEHPVNEIDELEMVTEVEETNGKHKMSFFTKLFIFSAVFCLIAVGIGAYLFWNGANLISAENIDVQISGPVSIAGGTLVSFDIVTTNNNNIELQMADLTVKFPEGTIDPSNPSQPLKTFNKFIGNFSPGQSDKETVRAIIYGEENLQKQIIATMTYGVKGSSSTFTKSKSYDVLLSSSPVSLSVSAFKEVTSGQEFDLKVGFKSNSSQVLKNILLKADFPFGYKFISSLPVSLGDNATWRIGDIPPGGQKTISIRGLFIGEDNDTKTIHFRVGSQSAENQKMIGTQYTATTHEITLQKPFITLNVAVNGDKSGDDDYLGQYGSNSRVTISWANSLSTSVSNMQISVKLSGSTYERGSVNPESGFFDSGIDTIVWSRQTNPDFASVGAGDSGTVSFSLTPRNLGSAGKPVINPTITIVASVSGNRIQENNVPQTVTAAVTKNIRISSSVDLSGRLFFGSGPFTNSGPIPPKIDQPTTYTVIWSADNASNAVGNASVKATLPPYVKWLNIISPSGEDLTYDSNSGLVTWNIGNLPAYTSSTGKRREVAFQISFTPSITQTGQSPNLVSQAILTATDNFTNANLSSQQASLTTRFSTDPTYRSGYEIVGR